MNSSARTTRSRRWTAAVVGGAAGAVLLGGGIALADGPGSDTAPSTAPDSGSPAGVPAPDGDRLVGTVTAVSEDSLTLTDDTGASHQVTLDGSTRYGGPGAGGPGVGGPGPGGPGAGGPGGAGSAPVAPSDGSTPPAPADGSAPAAPAAPADGSAPAAPSDGSTPPAPADGSAPAAPAAPADGSAPAAPAAPADGSAPAAPADGSAPPAPADGSAPAAPVEGSASDIAVGDRVEVRVSDGTALDVHEVRATVDGTVVSVDGTDLTVVTTPGLRVDVDAASLSPLPAVGDDVHLHGTVTDGGRTVVATEDTEGPR